MKIKLNGEDYTIDKQVSIKELLHDLDVQPQGVAVELNLKIVKKNKYSECQIKDGDRIEIVSFVGGG